MGKFAFLGDYFECADCVLFDAKVNHSSTDFSVAAETAHTLVQLRGSRTQESSQGTYASGLHRFVHFTETVLGKQPGTGLSRAKGEGVLPATVDLFMAWASSKYKVSTIKVTIASLVDWHKSKGIDHGFLQAPRVAELLRAIAANQGTEGIPKGKTGMSKGLLRLLLAWLDQQKQITPNMAEIYARDETWLILGFFGLLRRSELIELKMSDIKFYTTHFEVYIARSKNDRVGRGVNVVIAAESRDHIKLMRRVMSFHDKRNRQGASEEDKLLTKWDLDGFRLSNIPLSNGQALAERLKSYLRDLNEKDPRLALNPNSYGMHSLRRGGTVAAWEAGVEKEKLQAHGRWRSDAIKAYMTATLPIKLSVTSMM